MFDSFHILLVLAMMSIAGTVFCVVLAALGMRKVVRTNSPERGALPPDDAPYVSIMKPCAGADDDLEGCIESYCAIRYPHMQIVFGVRDRSDGALPIIERVKARHPELDIAVVISGEGRHPSPKVVNLEAMTPFAKHDLFWLTDSNTRVHPDTLTALVKDLQQPGVGAVASPIEGGEEKTFGAALENMQLNAFAGMMPLAVYTLLGIVSAAGKSVLLRRSTLDAIGSWDELGRYAGEDVMLYFRVQELGLKVVFGRHAVLNVMQHSTVAKSASRHMRWAQIRWRTVTPSTIFEPLLSPMLWGTFLALVSPWRLGLLAFATGAVVQAVTDLLATYIVRRRGIALAHLPAVWLRPWIVNWVWLRGLFTARFEWRGRAFWMGPQSTILTEPPTRSRLRALGARSI